MAAEIDYCSYNGFMEQMKRVKKLDPCQMTSMFVNTNYRKMRGFTNGNTLSETLVEECISRNQNLVGTFIDRARNKKRTINQPR